MRTPKHNIMVAAGLASVLVLGVCGCSFSSESTSTSSLTTEVTDEEGTTTTTTTESSSTVGTDGVSSSSSTTTQKTVSIEDWEAAWMGTSSTGETVFYAQSPEELSQALLAIYNPDTQELETYVGGFEMVADNALKITDVGNGNAYVFEILSDENGEAELNLGDDHGTATVSSCPMSDLIEALTEADVNGVFISE